MTKIEMLISCILTALAGIGTLLGAFLKTLKGKKTAVQSAQAQIDEATARAAKAEARLKILAEAKRLIQADEIDFKDLDELLQNNVKGTAGSVKFRMVLQALDCFCLRNGFEWNVEEITQLIKDEVAFTKTVNYTPSK
jgi:hypothetical protein